MQWNSNYKIKFLLTFTMLSAYFIIHDTSKPEQPKLRTTSHVTTSYPSTNLGIFCQPPSTTNLKKLNRTPNLYKGTKKEIYHGESRNIFHSTQKSSYNIKYSRIKLSILPVKHFITFLHQIFGVNTCQCWKKGR